MRKRIIAVDDESFQRRFIQRCLQEDFDVQVVASAAECLEILNQRVYDLLLTDCNMPGMNGYDLIMEIRKRHPQLPCMMVSSSVYEMEDTLAQDDIPYLPKPYAPSDLVHSVHTLLAA